ncbi:MAG: TraR/DksA family transcriptional regulator [Planctomycetota bacterium]|jgi:DnaK suppressor protein
MPPATYPTCPSTWRTSARTTTSRSLGLIEAEEREIREIDAALERIDEGSYGVCETCTKDIKVARLKAIPNARLCIECKRLEEENLL